MSIGNTQAYLDWAALQDDQRNERDWQELNSFMTQVEREEYEAWSDTLPHMRDDDHE